MKNILTALLSYLKANILKILVILVSYGIFLTVFSLYSLPTEAVAYASFLSAVFILTAGIIHFIRFYKKHMNLKSLSENNLISDYVFENTNDLIETDYQEIIKSIETNMKKLISAKDAAYSDMIEYYTIWVHQIKTPISAMRLLLQSEPSKISNELEEQLFKVEEYVEMVLQYLRMENMSNDLFLKKYPLDDIIKQAVRKYSKMFIRKKIKLNYEELNYYVLTDEKWLSFVIEQIISNALKYTFTGEISIYMDSENADTLVIEDTGIGIEPGDLPRVFENGYTGFNGRLNRKSTGIGLYLCKRILDKLSHTIRIESEPGKGTKVKIGLAMTEIAGE